jgi:LPS export ABC transporter protein LptC
MKINKFKKQYNYLLVLLLFALIIIWSYTEPNIDQPKIKIDLPDFSFENVIVSKIEDGIITVELDAKYAEIDKKTKTTKFKNCFGTFYKNSEPALTFFAPTSELDMNNSNMELYDATADIKTENNILNLKSDHLSWQADSQTFVGQSYTQIKYDNITLDGEYFHVNIPIRKIILSHNCHAEIEKQTWKKD